MLAFATILGAAHALEVGSMNSLRSKLPAPGQLGWLLVGGASTSPHRHLSAARLRGLRGGAAATVDAVIDLKNRGNTMFREKKFAEAKKFYDAALAAMPRGEAGNKERANCLNNRAACHVKMGDFVGCVEDCTAVLEVEPPNEKARLRRGIAYETLNHRGKAAADMVLLLIEKPDQQQARECLQRCVEADPTVLISASLTRHPHLVE